MEECTQIKHIVAISEKKESTTADEKKTPRKKITSQNEHWINTANIYSTQDAQLNLLSDLYLASTLDKDTLTYEDESSLVNPRLPTLVPRVGVLAIHANILLTHLKTKQTGYRSQDTIKGLYDSDRFIKIPDMVKLLAESNLSCFYCRKWTMLFYENVRDPRQWSLERLSNAEGHNRDNVVIACLECNMRRRTMYYERYIATKQLKVNKLEG